jgi:hypothetical protein
VRRFFAAALAAVSLTVAACSSAASSSPGAPAPGTETFTSGKVTSAKVLEAANPVLTLTYRGVVSATGTFSLGGAAPKAGQHRTFATSKGNLVLVVDHSAVTSKFVDAKTCLAQNTTTVSYSVDGASSTGSWKDAAGSGVVVVTYQGNSELKGRCSLAAAAGPVTMKDSYLLFDGAGPLTPKKT